MLLLVAVGVAAGWLIARRGEKFPFVPTLGCGVLCGGTLSMALLMYLEPTVGAWNIGLRMAAVIIGVGFGMFFQSRREPR